MPPRAVSGLQQASAPGSRAPARRRRWPPCARRGRGHAGRRRPRPRRRRPGGGPRPGTASASAWSTRASVGSAMATASSASRRASSRSPAWARASARTARHAMPVLRSSPPSRSLSSVSSQRFVRSRPARCGRGPAARPRGRRRRRCRARGSPRGPAAGGARRRPVAGQQLDHPGRHVDLEQAVRWPSSSSVAPGVGEHAAGGVVAAPQRLEHRLAAQRGGLDGGRPGCDAQHAHDVEAPAARAGRPGSGPTAPPRGAPASTPLARRRSPARRAAPSARSRDASHSRDATEPGQRRGPHRRGPWPRRRRRRAPPALRPRRRPRSAVCGQAARVA